MLFDRIKFDLRAAEAELHSFKSWLAAQAFIAERLVVAEIRKRPNMCCLLAASAGIPPPDLIRFELALQGLFRTDLVLGNDATRQFVLLEFEGALETSIFALGARQYRPWARDIEHGVSQVVDWAWLRADNPNSIVLTTAFGGPIRDSAYFVICGRDAGLATDMERRRFAFRRDGTSIKGTPLKILTYDGMVRDMATQMETMKSYANPV